MGIRAPRPWRLDSPPISGASRNCFSIRSPPLLGWNPNVCGDVVKHLPLSSRSQNDREGVLASILYPNQICPNDREGVLASSFEHIHRLVGFYHALAGSGYFSLNNFSISLTVKSVAVYNSNKV